MNFVPPSMNMFLFFFLFVTIKNLRAPPRVAKLKTIIKHNDLIFKKYVINSKHVLLQFFVKKLIKTHII
jgi:hypothetical protein